MRNTLPKTTRGFSDFVGIPYEVMNCWDIAVKFYSDILGVSLRDRYSGKAPEDYSVVENLIYTNKGDFEKVDTPEFGDIVLIQMHGYECHIGIFLGDNQLLHTMIPTGSIVDRLSKWGTRILGYYRIKKDLNVTP